MGGARVTCQHPPPFYKLTPTLLWALPGALDINSKYWQTRLWWYVLWRLS